MIISHKKLYYGSKTVFSFAFDTSTVHTLYKYVTQFYNFQVIEHKYCILQQQVIKGRKIANTLQMKKDWLPPQSKGIEKVLHAINFAKHQNIL